MPKKKITIEDVLCTIRLHLQIGYKGHEVNLKTAIKRALYSPETPNATIANWLSRKEYREQIEDLVKSFRMEIYTKNGKYGGTYVRMTTAPEALKF